MYLFILVEDRFGEVPKEITVIRDYGFEGIRSNAGYQSGNAMHLQGDAADFKKWLQPFKTVWHTSSPMTDRWEPLTLKDE